LNGVISLFLVVNFVADTAMRDESSQMAEILYCKPINPVTYQLGRFLGAFAVVVCVFSLAPLGLLLGGLMPWVDASRFGPVNVGVYLTSFLYLSVPTLFVFSCLFYALAIRLKSMMAVYLAVIGVLMFNEVADSLIVASDTRMLGALLDPFGWKAFNELTRYWTLVDKNSQMLTIDGILGQNRLLWLVVGVLVMALLGGFTRKLSVNTGSGSKKRSRGQLKKAAQNAAAQSEDYAQALHYSLTYRGQSNAHWQPFVSRTIFEVKQVIFDRAFLILCGSTLLMILLMVIQPKGMFGTRYLPVTQSMVEQIMRAMNVLSTVIITYYTAEIVWRERSSGMGDIIDSTPVVNLSFWLSKLVAVWLVLVILLLVAMAVTMIHQQDMGYERLDLTQYLISLLYFNALPWMMKAVLAFLLSVMSPGKYLGMLAFIVFIAADFVMEPLGLGHNMYRFSHSPGLVYSDMNGYGDSLTSHGWYIRPSVHPTAISIN
jgi:ABC-2 type transport system permease protein